MHEVSVINFPALIAGLTTHPDSVIADLARQPGLDEGRFLLTGARERVRLPQGDHGIPGNHHCRQHSLCRELFLRHIKRD